MRDGEGVTRMQMWDLYWVQPSPPKDGLCLLPVGCRFVWASGILGTHSIRQGRPPYLPQAAPRLPGLSQQLLGPGDQEHGLRPGAVTPLVD